MISGAPAGKGVYVTGWSKTTHMKRANRDKEKGVFGKAKTKAG